MTEWRWLLETAILAGHEQQIAEHGGRAGLRDLGLLQSALARPRHQAAYGDPDFAALAAAYAFGIIRNHPFVDGNKRAALLAVETFLIENGTELTADDAETLAAIRALADGTMSEEAFAAWVQRNCETKAEPG